MNNASLPDRQPEMASFDFKGNPLNVIQLGNNELWFLAKPVANILGYRDAANMIRNLDDDEKGTHIMSTPGGDQKVSIISESGLYAATLKSRRKEAKNFRRWVTSEVLPSIRRDGGYMLARPEETPEALALRAMQLLHATVERQKAQLAITLPKAAALDVLADKDGSHCITDAAKLLQIGPRFLFDYLLSHGWIYRRGDSRHLIAYQKHLTNGDLEHKITTIKKDKVDKDCCQVRIRQTGLVKLARILNPSLEIE